MRIAVLPYLLSIAWFGILSCTDNVQESDLSEPVGVRQTPTTPAEMLIALTNTTTAKDRVHLEDVVLILEARKAEEAKDGELAQSRWFQALSRSQDRFGRIAFNGWLTSYTDNLATKTDSKVLARLLLAEAKNGQISPYMIDSKLTTVDAIEARLLKLENKWVTKSTTGENVPDDPYLPPGQQGIPKDDPLLVTNASNRCQAHHSHDSQWTEWSSSLEVEVQVYWNALVNQCLGRGSDAIAEFNSVHSRLSRDPKTAPLAAESLNRLALMLRRNGKRAEVAEVYKELMNVWTKFKLAPSDFGENLEKFSLRRANDALWAARYRALISDYENAKIYAHKGLEFISLGYGGSGRLDDKYKKELAILKAEAYHILAYRIAVETQDYDGANAVMMLAMQISDLNEEWKDRLQWFSGLYEYLSGHYDTAKRRWENLLVETQDPDIKPMVYFWLAKAYDKLGQKAESRFYLAAVSEDYPISYYSVVAPKQAKLKGNKPWQQLFGSTDQLRAKLRHPVSTGFSSKNQSLLKSRVRAEVLLKAGLAEYANLAILDLAENMDKHLILENDVEAFIYLTRLYSKANLHLRAIALTTKLANRIKGFWKDYPEQLLVYFPQPYRDIFDQNAVEQSVDVELLLSIARRESGFTADIKSHADARGIMQLIHPTAARFAVELGFESDNLNQSLMKPEVNIALGSRFLRFLNGRYNGFKPAVYGSYNAGEYAMDIWLERRAQNDPLLFVELIPFGETKDYIKSVWRNHLVYNQLNLKGRPVRIDLDSSTSQPGISRGTNTPEPKREL